jgi:hypothetical protein
MANRESAFGYKNVSGANIQEFTKTGYWKKPNNATFVQVEIWGGGGGGGAGPVGYSYGGGGGGGGAYNYRLFNAACLCGTVLVTIGAGGAGGVGRNTYGSGTGGAKGGYTGFGPIAGLFSAYINAFGGSGGAAGQGSACDSTSAGSGGGALSAGCSPTFPGLPYDSQLQTSPFDATKRVSSAFGGAGFAGNASVACRLQYGIGQFGGGAGGSFNAPCYCAATHGRTAILGGGGGGAGGSCRPGCYSKNGGFGGGRLFIICNTGQLGAKGGTYVSGVAGENGANGCVVSTKYKQITLGYGGGGGARSGNNFVCAGDGGNGAIGGGGGGGGGMLANYCATPLIQSGNGGTGGGGFARIYTW